MKKLVYYRPPAPQRGAGRRSLRNPGIVRPVIVLGLFTGMILSVGYVVYKAAPLAAQKVASWERDGFSSWEFKEIQTAGAPAPLAQAIIKTIKFTPGQQVSKEMAETLQADLQKKFPELENVKVQRGLFSGKLRVSAAPRAPLAEIVSPSAVKNYVDGEGVIFPGGRVTAEGEYPVIAITGAQGKNTPEKVGKEFVQLIKILSSFKDVLPAASYAADEDGQRVKGFLGNGVSIDFGGADNLAKKAQTVSKILEYSKGRVKPPFEIDCGYYQSGKIYLKPQDGQNGKN